MTRLRMSVAIVSLVLLGTPWADAASQTTTGRSARPAGTQTPLVDAIADGAVLLQYECSDFKGMYMAAPAWTPDTDGMAGQVLRVTFRTDTGVSSVTSLLNGVEYNKETGAGAQLSSGFFFFLYAGDRVETYVYSGATAELFFTQMRSGNALLPNSVKGYRGSCVGNAPAQ
jgi:hypothetical protein